MDGLEIAHGSGAKRHAHNASFCEPRRLRGKSPVAIFLGSWVIDSYNTGIEVERDYDMPS